MNDGDVVARCAELVPAIALHAAEGEATCRVADPVLKAVDDAGLFRAVLPVSLGGEGVSLRDLCDGTRVLATACPASVWTISFLMMHVWLVSRFPASGHDELFASGPPLVAAPLAPTGQVRRDADGYRVSGKWAWATGIDHADWCMVHGVDDSVEFATRFALLPKSEVSVADDWCMAGMRATGSHTVTVDNVFVPEARTCTGAELLFGSDSVHDDQFGSMPLHAVLALTASAPAVGAAAAATDLYRNRVAERVLAYSPGTRAVEQPQAQARYAAVVSDLDALTAAWHAAIDAVTVAALDGRPDDRMRVRTRLAAAAAVRSSRKLIGEIGEGAGASVYASTHPFQRLQRDVETLKGHVVFDWDRTTELAGRVLLGQPLRPTDMA